MHISLKTLLLSGTTIALLGASPTYAQDTQTDKTPSSNEVKEVVVTGSRISRTVKEGAAPIHIITNTDLERQGFRSVFDALTNSTANTGQVQGEDFGSTFTPAANVISLRGLGPNHTLTLINGRRVADYPIAYQGTVNAVNLANIPSAMIDQIEILTGGAGAIYGSDAIAGVVNIKLKKKVDEYSLSLRLGGTDEGGGESQRLQFVGGNSFDRLNLTYSAELSNREPIYWGQRKISNSYTKYNSDPDVVPPALISNRNPSSKTYYDPPVNCLGQLQGGTLKQITSPTYGGSYCGSDAFYNYRTLQTSKQSGNVYISATYTIDDKTEIFANALVGKARVENALRAPSWSLPAAAFYNTFTGRLENWTRTLTVEEYGGKNGANNVYDEISSNFVLGIKGALPISDWTYEAALNRSDYVSEQGRIRFLNGLDSVFLGQQVGTQKIGNRTYAAYNADPAKLFAQISPDTYHSLTRRSTSYNWSYAQDLSASASGTLFTLPAGPIKAAVVAEWGKQGFKNDPDPAINRGDYWNTSVAQGSGGNRDRYAAGLELRVPVIATVDLNLAGRYDSYHFQGHDISQGTYNVGVEYRPWKQLLIRGTYSTNFRAPDMSYLFSTRTLGYNPGVTDTYQCRLLNKPEGKCNIQYNMNYEQSGGANLKPEEGKNWTAGFVWSPLNNLDFQVDYYDVTITNEVTNLSTTMILLNEANCRLGKTKSGDPVDANSALCRDYVGRVDRNAADSPINPNQVTLIRVNPINAAGERTTGVDSSLNLRWNHADYGRFRLGLTYTRVLRHTFRQFAGDPVRDYLNPISYQSDWRTKFNSTLNWQKDKWGVTLTALNSGTIPLGDSSGRRKPYTTGNLSVRYDITPRATASFTVNNFTNEIPTDKTGGWPYYSSGWYDAVGRQFFFQVDYRFGGGK